MKVGHTYYVHDYVDSQTVSVQRDLVGFVIVMYGESIIKTLRILDVTRGIIDCELQNKQYSKYVPVLYFIITPTGSRHSCTVWGKFEHCVNVEQRIRSYSLPSKKYASVEYDYKVYMERPVDNIINRIILKKGSQSPLVNFMQSDRSNAKIDWFEISGAAAYNILDVMEKLNAIKSQEYFDCFTADLLAIIATYSFRRSLVPLQYKSDHYMFILEHDQFMIDIDKEGIKFFEKECCPVVGTNY